MIITVSDAKIDRLNKASLHDEAMREKYHKMHPALETFNEYHNWFEEIAPDNSTNIMGVRMRYDYPLPYSQTFYFRRFAELFFSAHAERHMRETLAHEFIGDETDAEYIEGLLITAKEYGFFAPNALIVFNESGERKYAPPISGGYYLVEPRVVGFQESYQGSEVNKDRAEVIKDWLRKRAIELSQQSLKNLNTKNKLAPTSTLEGICKGDNNTMRGELAKKIDAIFEKSKEGSAREDYPVLCVAVYKLAVRLNKIETEIRAAQWTAVLSARYGISISEGISKYTIDNPRSSVFTKAVVRAFGFISDTYPTWTKGKHLPPIYQ